MLNLTTPDGRTFTADTDVRLASQWADAQLGTNWDIGLCPFELHTTMDEFIDEIHAMHDGDIAGYSVTTPGGG